MRSNKDIIELKNLSKFYYNKGVIASGFSKVNLKFQMGEFVAITGESGSGKSTLLNVISGLDTYEEGEMYINGEETSHYSEKDFEDYRRKYIGNIFQNFNLVNSYTVFQNIELVLLLNGNKKKDVKKRVLELIKKVGLYKFRNTKVSKLSGGQKQRVAIARALAKDTPIIIADEPTGNLDSESSSVIIKLLSEIAKDKLVIIVTHNYEQVEDYVTRKIKMYDGKVLEDKRIREVLDVNEVKQSKYRDIRFVSKLRLGIRNTYNIIPKFLLILAVYLFVTIALISEYASFKEQEYVSSKQGYNYLFSDTDDTRIVIKKIDKTVFTEEDYDNVSKIDNVLSVVRNDLLLDTEVFLTDDNNYWLYGTVNSIDNFSGEVDKGRMPTSDNEVVIVGSSDDYYLGYMADEIIDKEVYIENTYTGIVDKDVKLKIVGIKYDESNNLYSDSQFYVSGNILSTFSYQINQQYSSIKVLFRDKYYESYAYSNEFMVVSNDKVKEGEAYISEDLNYLCKNENCLKESLEIEVSNLYYTDSLKLVVTNTYNKKNMESKLGIKDYDEYAGCVFISSKDYDNLFNKNNYQSSVYVSSVTEIDKVVTELNDMGISTLKMSDVLVTDTSTSLLQIVRTVVTVILVIVLFFISYFVIRLILKSRNVYFTTIRMLGGTKRVSRDLLVIELLNVSNLAYFMFMIVLGLGKLDIINLGFIDMIIKYLTVRDYIVLYLILIFMSYLISMKFSKKLFKNSVMKTLVEEV